MCWIQDIFSGEDRRLGDFPFNDLDFLNKVKDRAICEEKGFGDKKKKRMGKVQNNYYKECPWVTKKLTYSQKLLNAAHQ